MITREDRGNLVVFKRTDGAVEEVVGLYKVRKGLGNAIYQRWRGNAKTINYIAKLEDVGRWLEKEQITEDEFNELIEQIRDNTIFW